MLISLFRLVVYFAVLASLFPCFVHRSKGSSFIEARACLISSFCRLRRAFYLAVLFVRFVLILLLFLLLCFRLRHSFLFFVLLFPTHRNCFLFSVFKLVSSFFIWHFESRVTTFCFCVWYACHVFSFVLVALCCCLVVHLYCDNCCRGLFVLSFIFCLCVCCWLVCVDRVFPKTKSALARSVLSLCWLSVCASCLHRDLCRLVRCLFSRLVLCACLNVAIIFMAFVWFVRVVVCDVLFQPPCAVSFCCFVIKCVLGSVFSFFVLVGSFLLVIDAALCLFVLFVLFVRVASCWLHPRFCFCLRAGVTFCLSFLSGRYDLNRFLLFLQCSVAC